MTNVTPIVNPVPAPSEWHDDDTPWHEIENDIDPRDTVVYSDGSALDNPGRVEQLPTLKNRKTSLKSQSRSAGASQFRMPNYTRSR